MSIAPTEIRFVQIVDDCIAGKTIKKQALELLKNMYDSVYKNIKKEFGEDRVSLCCHGEYEFDAWIKICDGVERNKPRDSKWKTYHHQIQKVINNYEADCGKVDLESGDCAGEVFHEVHQIQNLCRENRELTELYEKYKAKIKNLPAIPKKQIKNTPEDIIQILLNHIPPKVKQHEGKKVKDKTFPHTYWITTSIPDVESFLGEKQKSGEIVIDDIRGFIETYLRGTKGGQPARSYVTKKSHNKQKNNKP